MCTPGTPGCSAVRDANRQSPLPEPVDVLAAPDPLGTTLEVLRAGGTLLLRTSGSSGRPRRVVRRAESWSSSFPVVSELLDLTAESRLWVPGPLTATMNLFAAAHARHSGATLVDVPAEATHAVLTPAALDRALIETSLRSGLRVVVAGDRLESPLHDRAEAAGMRVCHYYGAAELSFVAWGPHAADLRAFPGAEVESRDGVLWVRSPYLADGYDAGPGPFRVGRDGFATVGDLGAVDGERVVVHGRGDDAVTTAGATVLVADVERVLRAAASGELVVVAAPHPTLGAVVACVLTDPTDRPSLVARARAQLDTASRPRLWFHLAQLPLGSHGKVDRATVRALVAAGALARMA